MLWQSMCIKKNRKVTNLPQEVLVVIKGSLEASIFDEKGIFIAKKHVTAGQCVFFVDGGHEVKMTKNVLIYTFKDGPHVENKIFLP